MDGCPLFDLNVYPYPITERLFAPGFLVFPPNGKAARGRDNNLLLIYFTLIGQTPITAEGLRTWMEKKAETFHRNPGTVTAGMRELIESVNTDLYERNVRPNRQNSQVTMNMQVAVLKREMLYLASCGNGQSFLIGNEANLALRDNESASRGLGLSQSIAVRFSQSVISANDLLLLSFNTPANWTADLLQGGQALSIEAFARRLFTSASSAGRGVIIRFQEGSGKVSCLRINQAQAEAPAVSETKEKETVIAAPIVLPESPVEPADENIASPITKIEEEPQVPSVSESVNEINESAAQETPFASVPQPAEPVIQLRRITRPGATGNPRLVHPPVQEEPVEEPADEPAGEPVEEAPAVPLFQTEAVKEALGKTLRKGAEVKNQTGSWLKDLIKKIMPGDPNQNSPIPRGILIFIAVAIPVIIVAVATTIYIRSGRNNEASQYLALAQQVATRADSEGSDSATRLASLKESLTWLDKADQYGKTDDSTTLRNQIQTAIDSLEGIIRVDMSPALSDLTLPGMNITQMVATNSDLYALDGISGKVLRFSLSGSSYVEDTHFDCGPNPENPLNTIGKLVDLVAIPVDNTYNATIMAVDATGTLEYCVPGDSGYVVNLAAPDMGWGAIQSISLYQSNLYVLDITGNAVYRFEGNGTDFPDKPTLFFDEEIPPLTDALDIEEVGYELNILRGNGEMVKCTYSPLKDMKSTHCDSPAQYLNTQTGQDVEVNSFPDTQFTQLHLTEAPDSSLYILDAAHDTLYQFSYKLSLQRELHPRMTDGVDADTLTPTSFAVSPTRLLFMAYSNQIYYGQMP
jgi:hypothetical protein